jgi:hypothetical protein
MRGKQFSMGTVLPSLILRRPLKPVVSKDQAFVQLYPRQ